MGAPYIYDISRLRVKEIISNPKLDNKGYGCPVSSDGINVLLLGKNK
jgi:hypothetical protein